MALPGSASLGSQSDESDPLHYACQYYWPVWKFSCLAETRAENEAKSVKAIIDMPDHVTKYRRNCTAQTEDTGRIEMITALISTTSATPSFKDFTKKPCPSGSTLQQDHAL
jgi:hypothetical protein